MVSEALDHILVEGFCEIYKDFIRILLSAVTGLLLHRAVEVVQYITITVSTENIELQRAANI